MDSLLPFLQGTCTPYNMPVYPGARRLVGKPSLTLLFPCLRLPVGRKPSSVRLAGDTTGTPRFACKELDSCLGDFGVN